MVRIRTVLLVTHVPLALFAVALLVDGASVALTVAYLATWASAAGLSIWGYHTLRRRIDATVAFANGIAEGNVREPLRTLAPGALGRIESALNLLAEGVAARERSRVLEARRTRFAGELGQAFEHAEDEAGVFAVAARALERTAPSALAELLLADSSHAPIRRVVATGRGDVCGCGVESPYRCPAVRRGRAISFDEPEALDRCPHLLGRSDASAHCVPVTVLGRPVGVLSVVGTEADELPSFERLGAIAQQLGGRLGVIQALATSQRQASTDSLTGVLNRRGFEARLAELERDGSACVVVMADLDRFKQLNDTHGHDGGDRALRLFSEVVVATLRQGDLVARFGGEEFVLALPRVSVEDAAAVLERVRGALRRAVAKGGVPPFTASFGVSTSLDLPLEERLREADAAVYRAKADGRDRVVVGDGSRVDPDLERPLTLAPARA
ncbi:MAG: diguanylate cyclase [Myxococcota bacterium]